MNLLTQLRWHFRKARYGKEKAQVKVGLLLARIEDEFGKPLYWFSRAAFIWSVPLSIRGYWDGARVLSRRVPAKGLKGVAIKS